MKTALRQVHPGWNRADANLPKNGVSGKVSGGGAISATLLKTRLYGRGRSTNGVQHRAPSPTGVTNKLSRLRVSWLFPRIIGCDVKCCDRCESIGILLVVFPVPLGSFALQ